MNSQKRVIFDKLKNSRVGQTSKKFGETRVISLFCLLYMHNKIFNVLVLSFYFSKNDTSTKIFLIW